MLPAAAAAATRLLHSFGLNFQSIPFVLYGVPNLGSGADPGRIFMRLCYLCIQMISWH